MKRAHIITKLGKASEIPEVTPSWSEQPGAWQMKVHDVLLQQVLDSASLLPIEAGKMAPWSLLHNDLAKLANVTSPVEMESISEMASEQKALQDQLILSIKKASTAVNRIVTQRATHQAATEQQGKAEASKRAADEARKIAKEARTTPGTTRAWRCTF